MTGGTASSALRLLREAPWARALLGVLALAAIFVLLGRWQLDRRQERDERNARVEANYGAQPVPLAQLLPRAGTPLPASLTWRPVSVSGVYQPADTLLVRNRTLRGDGGYEVLVPLRTETGRVLLVDRGWLPAGRTGAGPDRVPAPPPGPVELVVRLRPGEEAGGRRAPPGQLPAVDLQLVADALDGTVGSELEGGYGVLAAESPRPAQAPVLLPRPEQEPGPHLAYAVQWFGFAAAPWCCSRCTACARRRRGPDRAPDVPAAVPVARPGPDGALAGRGRSATRRPRTGPTRPGACAMDSRRSRREPRRRRVGDVG